MSEEMDRAVDKAASDLAAASGRSADECRDAVQSALNAFGSDPVTAPSPPLGYPQKQGPLITDGSSPFAESWERDPQTDDGHAHDWEVVMLGPPGHHRVEEVVRCAVCQCPRCGHTYDLNPCLLRRHHQPRWPEHEYANGGREMVGG